MIEMTLQLILFITQWRNHICKWISQVFKLIILQNHKKHVHNKLFIHKYTQLLQQTNLKLHFYTIIQRRKSKRKGENTLEM